MKKTIRTLRSMGFKAASKGDQAFADMHPVQVVDAHDEKVSKALDDIANAKGVIPYDRVANKHGYEKGEDEAAYDSFKHNAGGPVVAPVYTKPMHESIRSCHICLGKACEHCNETGYAIEESEHSNAVVRHLRRQQLEEMTMQGLVKAYDNKKAAWKKEADDVRALGQRVSNSKTGRATKAVGRGMAAVGRTLALAVPGARDIERAGMRKEDIDQVNEASNMRLIKTFTAGPHSAKVYKDREWGEYRVQFHKDGKHLKKADSHHDDRTDAFGTAQHQLKRMAGVNEDVELDEGLGNFVQGLKQKAVATYNDLEDKYQGGPQRRAMQLAKAVKAKKDQQVSRISGKASGYENKAKDLTSYASQSLAKAAAAKQQASRVQIPNHNMHQVTTTDEYERKKAEIANATATKAKLATDAQSHLEQGLKTYNDADRHAARAAKIKDRLDAALAGRSKLLGRGKPKPTAFQSRLKKVERAR